MPPRTAPTVNARFARAAARAVRARGWTVRFALLTLLGACGLLRAEMAWLHAGNTAAELTRATGLPGSDLRVAWRDACFNPHQPAQNLGTWELMAVAPERRVPPQSSFALLSFTGWIGDLPGQVPPDAIVTSARLWLHVEQVSGSFAIRAMSLPAADAGWSEFTATADHPNSATEPAWSGGTLAGSLKDELATFAAPSGPGWFQVPLELAEWANALRAGQSGGLALIAGGPAGDGTRGLFCSSADSPAPAHRPALWIGWRRPRVGLRLPEVAATVATHEGLPTSLVIQDPDFDSLSVDGQPVAPTATGTWRLHLGPGRHRLEANGSHGPTTRNVEVVERLLWLAPPVRTASGRASFGWDTLPGWTYTLEGGDLEGRVWEALYQTTDRGGWVGVDVPANARHTFFRLRARTDVTAGPTPGQIGNTH